MQNNLENASEFLHFYHLLVLGNKRKAGGGVGRQRMTGNRCKWQNLTSYDRAGGTRGVSAGQKAVMGAALWAADTSPCLREASSAQQMYIARSSHSSLML